MDIAQVVGLFGIFVTLVVNVGWSAVRDRRAARQTNFANYSSRYSSLMAEIVSKTDIASSFDQRAGGQRALAVQFFMLLSEEEYLAEKKLIHASIVNIWRDGLDATMKHLWFQGAWQFCRANFDFEGVFAEHVDAILLRLPPPIALETTSTIHVPVEVASRLLDESSPIASAGSAEA